MSLLTNNKNFPQKGDKLKFIGANKMFYPHFTDMVERGKKDLKIGEIYTVSKVEVYSSWCAVWLEESSQDDKHYYNLGMFDYPVLDCFQEIKRAVKDTSILYRLVELRNSADKLELLLKNSSELLEKYNALLEENKILKQQIHDLTSNKPVDKD